MTDVVLRSRQDLIKDITSLETQLSDLQERFDLIVNWISCQFHELIGLPESIATAVRGNQRPPEIDQRIRGSEEIEIKSEQFSEFVNEEGSSSCNPLEHLTILSTNDETEQDPHHRKKLIVKLDKLLDTLFMTDTETLKDNYDISNFHSLKPALETKQTLHVQKTNDIQVNRRQNLLLDAAEYEDMVASLSAERLTCAVCHKQFSTPGKVLRHELKIHLTKEQQIKFRIKEKRKNVSTVEQVKKPSCATKCEICGLVIKNRNLKQHKATHIGKRNFLCNQCGQSFNRSNTLRRHVMAIHEKVRNYKCQYCGKTFVFNYVKLNHEKKHLGALKVKCDLCSFTFTCKNTLRIHIKGVHENQRNFKCRFCDKCFKTSHARNYHVNTHNNPNGRNRGLNVDVDPMKAAAKRRNCPTGKNYRVPELTTLVTEVETEENPNTSPSASAAKEEILESEENSQSSME